MGHVPLRKRRRRDYDLDDGGRGGAGTTSARLSELQIAKLENVGFEWQGAKMQNWESNYKLLQVCGFVLVVVAVVY